jgi:diacylglycerol kinase (ATP)
VIKIAVTLGTAGRHVLLLERFVRATIIFNPTSGRGRATTAAHSLSQRLTSAGIANVLCPTNAPGAARKAAATVVREGGKVVVGCGGDGTLQEIAESLHNTETALGLLPCGRCNDLARALKLPRTAEEALSGLTTALRSSPLPLRHADLGLFRPQTGAERVFCTVATLGFDTAVSRFVEQRRLPLQGAPAYVYGALRVLPGFRFPRVRLRGDFGEFAGEILLAATGNTDSYGGAMKIVPPAKVDDGLLHVCVVKRVPKTTVLTFLPRVAGGSHLKHPAVSVWATRELNVETPDGPQWICADGETLGSTPGTFSILPKALRIVDSSVPQ